MTQFKILGLLTLSLFSFSANAQQKNSPAKVNASKIIRMSNSVIILNNENMDVIDSYKQIVVTADNNVKRLKNNDKAQVHFVNYKIYTPNQRSNAEYAEASKIAPAFDEKTALIETMTEANSNMTNMVKWSKALSDYFSNKEYLTDTSFENYPTLKDSTLFYVDKAYSSWRTASQLAATAGDKAELLLLKDSKIADFVIPMKTDLINLKTIFSKIGDPQSDLSSIENDITSLKASIEKNKDISSKDVKKLSDIYYKEVYMTFYSKCTQSVDTLGKLANMLKDGEKDGDSLSSFFASAQSSYGQAIEQYNTFIKQ